MGVGWGLLLVEVQWIGVGIGSAYLQKTPLDRLERLRQFGFVYGGPRQLGVLLGGWSSLHQGKLLSELH